MIASPTQQPPLGLCGGSVHSYIRGTSPWHESAFPDDLKHAALERGMPLHGWFGQDWCGNDIVWIPDGTEFK
jgi:hypothetical protein